MIYQLDSVMRLLNNAGLNCKFRDNLHTHAANYTILPEKQEKIQYGRSFGNALRAWYHVLITTRNTENVSAVLSSLLKTKQYSIYLTIVHRSGGE